LLGDDAPCQPTNSALSREIKNISLDIRSNIVNFISVYDMSFNPIPDIFPSPTRLTRGRLTAMPPKSTQNWFWQTMLAKDLTFRQRISMNSLQLRKDELAARVAWMYFLGKKTQREIALALELSRPTVNRLIATATKRGLVTVRFNHPLAECVKLADRLCKRFNLSLCEVAPLEGNFEGSPIRPIAAVGAAVFERYLADPKVKVIAMGAGRTLRTVIDETAETDLPDLKILSITGSVSLDGSFNRYNAGLRAADRTGAKHFLLPVPLVADSPEGKERWCRHDLYRLVNNLYVEADVAFIGIGHIAEKCPMVQDGFITREEARELVAQGAVADVLGWPLDRTGKLVTSTLTERVTSMSLATLAARPVIALVGGPERVSAILAALRGHWISGLVTDQETARSLLML
jgi:DNA-binding transcriptional regulator LsrR (DeoR family)